MKNNIMVVLFTLVTMVSFGQAKQVSYKTPSNPIKLEYEKDEFTGKEYLFVSSNLLVSDDGKKGFFLRPSMKKENGKWIYSYIAGKQVGIGSCNEEDKLYFIFDDDTKFQMEGWRDFNCDGNIGFDLYGKFLDNLQKPIKAIKYVNGRTFDSYQKVLTKPEEKNYFINFYNALKQYNK